MISIIVSTYKSNDLIRLRINIDKTIGVPYEIIPIENYGQMGICEVYNKGAQLAKYEIICFSHEDIEIKTYGWGYIVADIFKSSNVGLLGVAGSSYKTFAPGPFLSYDSESDYLYLIQKFRNSSTIIQFNNNPSGASLGEVVCTDGVWLCSTKKVVSEIKFDEKTFKGFHCYDLDFSLSVSLQYKVLVTFDILLEHFSEGSYNKDWVEETCKLFYKWKDILPISTTVIPLKKQQKVERMAYLNFFNKMNEYDFAPAKMYELLHNRPKQVNMGFVNVSILYYQLMKEVLKYFFKINLKSKTT